jgi:peptide/nickel transport system ATP-binding protein
MIKSSKLLEINGLDVSFSNGQETIYAVRDVSITVNPGEVLGIVGESGAGKSTIGNAIINLIDPPGKIINGEILFQDQTLRPRSIL